MSGHKNFKSNPFERSQPVTSDFLNVPLLGMVRADLPKSSGDYDLRDLVTNFQDTDNSSFTLEVLDDAMKNAGILKGDFLTVNLNSRPADGDIVVFKLGERFYIRKYFQQNNLIRLETVDDYPTTLVIENKTPSFEILGKVQSVTRRF